LLHISDLHFGTRGVEQMADVVHEAAERIAPDAVIASGDLVEWAEKPSAWRGVAAFLSRFRPPVLTVPGNHDIERVNVFSRFARPFRAYRRHVHEQLDRAVSIGGAHLVGMCSPSRITLDLGYVSRQQIEWAADSFAGADQAALRVLVVHHGVRPLRRRLFRNHLRGRKLEKPLLARGVDLVLTGHRHFPYAEQLTGPSGGQLLWSQAGTATCARLHPGQRANSFSVIQADREQIEVTWWHYQADRRGFEPGESLSFQRRRPAELPAPAGLLPEPV
jgi:3',5'-cyclic AMP phosphodiesterase CpdA